MSEAATATAMSDGPEEGPRGPALLGYIEDMLLQLAHMASAGGEQALAASLAIAAIQAGTRRLKTADT